MNIKDIEQASVRLQNLIHHIPVATSRTFSELSGAELYLKYENQQKTGSFKVRGAYNKLAHMSEINERPERVVASSAGNHAQGVAFASSALGIDATIVMPRSTPIAKVSATEGYGAHVVLYGDCYDDAYKKALEIQQEEGAVFIHPFDDYDIIAGQGTIGLEILRDLPAVDTVIVPAGGGGLLSGIAYCIKQINPRVEVIGVQAEGADAIFRSFEAGGLVSTESSSTIADGISVRTPGEITMELIHEYADRIVTVSDAEIAAAILLLLERTKQLVEPAGAAALTAAISGRLPIAGKKVACVVSGGNIDVSFIHRIVEKGLITRGRQMRFSTIMLDIPGSLECFSRILAERGANVIMVQHDRLNADLDLNEAILHVACEVSSAKHGREILRSLETEGYRIIMK